MSLAVAFGNPRSLIYQPGSYTVVDASELAAQPAFVYNTVGVLGAGLGGVPMVPYVFNDPLQAQLVFGSASPLYEAIRLAFMGGVNGGAATVVGMRIDDCAQATGALSDPNSGTSILAKFDDFGAYGNTYALSFLPGSAQGTMAILQGQYLDGRTFFRRWDNEPSFSQLLERITQESPITLELLEGGTRASQTLTIATSQVDGRALIIDSQGQQRSNQVHIYQYPLTLRQSTDSMLATFSASTSWEINSINTSANTFSINSAHELLPGNYVSFSGNVLPGGISGSASYVVSAVPSSTTFKVQAVGLPLDFAISGINTVANLFTVPGHTLTNGDIVQFTSTTQFSGITADNTNILADSMVLPNGISAYRNYFVINSNDNVFQVATEPGGIPLPVAGTISGTKITRIAAAGDIDITGSIESAMVHLSLGRATVSASTPALFNGFRESTKTVPRYSQAFTNIAITAAAYSSDSARFTLPFGQTWNNAASRGLPGAIFTIASGTYQGTYQILHHEWDGLSGDRTRIVRKLSGDRRIASGTLSATLEFYGAHLFNRLQPAQQALESALPKNGILPTGGQFLSLIAGETTVQYSTLPGDTIERIGTQLVNLLNQSTDSLVFASAAYDATNYTSTVTVTAKTPGALGNNILVNLLINVQAEVLIGRGGAALAGGIDPQPPRNTQGVTSGVLTFSGGFDSVPVLQRWVDAADRLKTVPVRYVVPAGTDNLGVQQLIADHCTLMSTSAQRRERICILGHRLGWSKRQIRERASLFQSERVVFVSPGIVLADAQTGNPRTYPAFYTAAMIAGMLAAEGNGISDPITNTFLRNVQALELTYQPNSNDLDEMMQAGVLTLERDPSVTRASRGFRVTRGINTWRVTGQSALKSGALAFITTVNQSDYAAAFIRDMQDQLFIGRGIFSETPEQVRVFTNAALAQLVRERALYGYDPQFTQVTQSPQNQQALDCVYRIYPAPNLDFVLNTQVLLPLSTAV